jgi:hypothetical protein
VIHLHEQISLQTNTTPNSLGLDRERSAAPRISLFRFSPGSETKQGLERSHWYSPPIVTKDEFIQIHLKLITAHAVVGPNKPLL